MFYFSQQTICSILDETERFWLNLPQILLIQQDSGGFNNLFIYELV